MNEVKKIETKNSKIATSTISIIYLLISIKESKVVLLKFKTFSITPSKLITTIIIARLLSKKILA